MAQAAAAYRYDAFLEPAEERFSSSDVRAVRTGGGSQQAQQHQLIATAAKMAAILLAVVAVLCFARIALTNAAVTTMIESDALTTQISEARSTGVSLEMEQSLLTSTSAINSAVKRLNMVAPYVGETIVLDPDVVAYNGDGNLSLSETIKNAAGA